MFEQTFKNIDDILYPDLFKSEEKLREIWSRPGTRKKLLEELQERGFAKAQ
ncbi:hypothetical protein [Pontibacter harenae]|uniref:hypothetical protein n=1 Tax=Pontibacter harenae TaxID=2894083 RepID=UPI001E58F833|nr:hypothetical protein [Pontibacter harenae]MCC9168653.1 hypothetical protein [Pontibacter harenae]